MSNNYKLKIHHVGFIVANLEEAINYFKETYCIKDFQTWEFNPMSAKVNGIPVEEYKLRVAMGSFPDGDTKLEIIEPVTPLGCHYNYIQERKKGIHHLCFTADNYDYWYSHFQNKSVNFIFEAEIEDDIIGYRRCFYAEDKQAGLIFEIREAPYFRNKN